MASLGLTRLEQIRVGVYGGALALVAIVANVFVIHFAERDKAHPYDHATAKHWLVAWAVVTGAALLLTALLGGLFALTTRCPWHLVTAIAFASGPVVGAATYLTLAFTGQLDAGSATCGDDHDCNLGIGFGAAFLSVAVAIPLGTTFLLVYAIRRGAIHLLRRRLRPASA